MFGRQFYGLTSFYGNFYCLQLWGSFVSRTKAWKNRRLANFPGRPSRGGVRQCCPELRQFYRGDGREHFLPDARAVEISRYFPYSRKPANVNVQKHAKRATVCILKYKWKRAKPLQAKSSHRIRNWKVIEVKSIFLVCLMPCYRQVLLKQKPLRGKRPIATCSEELPYIFTATINYVWNIT